MLEIVVPLGPVAQLKVSGNTPHELLADLTAVEQSEIPMTLGRVINKVGVQESLGRILGAEQVDVVPHEDEGQDNSAQQTEPQQVNVPEWAEVVPDAPLINGVPAWKTTIPIGGFPTPVFVHPTENIDQSLPKTGDPNDPRLARGEAMFFKPLS